MLSKLNDKSTSAEFIHLSAVVNLAGKKRRQLYRSIPSIFGATFPRDSLLNFNEEIPVGLYSSNSGSTDSLITNVAA